LRTPRLAKTKRADDGFTALSAIRGVQLAGEHCARRVAAMRKKKSHRPRSRKSICRSRLARTVTPENMGHLGRKRGSLGWYPHIRGISFSTEALFGSGTNLPAEFKIQKLKIKVGEVVAKTPGGGIYGGIFILGTRWSNRKMRNCGFEDFRPPTPPALRGDPNCATIGYLRGESRTHR